MEVMMTSHGYFNLCIHKDVLQGVPHVLSTNPFTKHQVVFVEPLSAINAIIFSVIGYYS